MRAAVAVTEMLVTPISGGKIMFRGQLDCSISRFHRCNVHISWYYDTLSKEAENLKQLLHCKCQELTLTINNYLLFT